MHYGVIVDVDENSVGIVDVDYKDNFVRCYDEVGANYERDRNNVQLKHCPPPFTKVSRGVPGRVYAMADMENPVILQKSHLPAYSLQWHGILIKRIPTRMSGDFAVQLESMKLFL